VKPTTGTKATSQQQTSEATCSLTTGAKATSQQQTSGAM